MEILCLQSLSFLVPRPRRVREAKRAMGNRKYVPCFYLTNRFQFAVRLFSYKSQMTSKCGKNKKVAHEAIACVSLMFLLTGSSDFVNPSYDYKPNWTPLSPFTIINSRDFFFSPHTHTQTFRLNILCFRVESMGQNTFGHNVM